MAVFTAVASLPADSCATVTMKAEVSYQTTENTTVRNTTTSTQERFTATMNMDSRFSTKLRMVGMLRFDVLTREKDPGSTSTEIQPNINLKFFTKEVQLNMGYRQLTRDETTIKATNTSNVTTESSDATIDSTIKAGALPDMRFKYSTRENFREDVSAGVTNTRDTTTDQFKGSINYKLGIFSANADYSTETETNNVDGTVKDRTFIVGQLSATKRFSQKVTAVVRESYSLSDIKETGKTGQKREDTASELRLTLSPVQRSIINTSYIYSVQKDNLEETTEGKWFTTASYTLPRYFRFYGSYSTRETDTGTRLTNADSTVLGMNFKHNIGKFNFTARYESRVDTSAVSITNGTKDTEITTSKLDWLIDAKLNKFLAVALSEAYVLTDSNDAKSENTKYRLKADIGPIRNLSASPYIDYTLVNTESKTGTLANSEITTTELVVPITYRQEIGDKINLSLTDNYRSSTKEAKGSTNSSSTNNLVLRLSMPRVTKSLSLSGDASFNTSTTETKTTSTSTSTSSYILRANWTNAPHRLNANISYETGNESPTSTSMGLQYTLALRLKKLLLKFQASYIHNTTQNIRGNKSTGQKMFVLFSLSN